MPINFTGDDPPCGTDCGFQLEFHGNFRALYQHGLGLDCMGSAVPFFIPKSGAICSRLLRGAKDPGILV